jgi:hypothetical protein
MMIEYRGEFGALTIEAPLINVSSEMSQRYVPGIPTHFYLNGEPISEPEARRIYEANQP